MVEKERQVAVSKDYCFSDHEEKDDLSRVEQHQGKTFITLFFRLRENVTEQAGGGSQYIITERTPLSLSLEVPSPAPHTY